MAKTHVIVGYASMTLTAPGVWSESIEDRPYTGDLLQTMSRWRDNAEQVNPNLSLQNRLSILADPFANDNFHNIRYIKWAGGTWEVTGVDVNRPRLILTIGGVYNEQKISTTATS